MSRVKRAFCCRLEPMLKKIPVHSFVREMANGLKQPSYRSNLQASCVAHTTASRKNSGHCSVILG